MSRADEVRRLADQHRLRFDPLAIVLLMASAVCFYLAFHIH